MSDSIKLSPKHGVNPCIPVCFFCGKEKNEIALLGKLPDDAKAPMKAILDYEPCEECTKLMEQGVTIIEALQTPAFDGIPPIQDNLYPTGRFCVFTIDAANRIFTNNPHNPGDKLFADEEFMNKILN